MSPTTSKRLDRPSVDDAVSLADWLESAVVVEGKNRASKTWIRKQLRAVVFPETGSGTSDLDSELDLGVEFCLSEIARRSHLARSAYPFRTDDGSIAVQKGTQGVPYLFLLCISTSPSMRRERRHKEVDLPFDLLIKQALLGYLGAGGEALRFAFPSSDGRPKSFVKALDWLAGRLGLQRGTAKPRPKRKDGGVDVVAWRAFGDTLGAYLAILAQCTVQRDWLPKARDVNATLWNGMIVFGCLPAACLAIPFVVPPDFTARDEVAHSVSLFLERIRIIQLLNNIPKDLLDAIWNWTSKELQSMGAQDPEALDEWLAIAG